MKALRFVSSLALVCCCLGATAGIAVAAPGDLDRSFGEEGIVTLASPPGAHIVPSDMAVGPDNAIYVLRRQLQCLPASCQTSLTVTRQIPNGTPDTSFGVGGVAYALVGQLDLFSTAPLDSMALAADGKILVAASYGQSLLLARLNPNGSLDGGFGQGGVVKTDLGAGLGRTRIGIHGDGRIVVAVERATAAGSAVVVLQYTQEGLPDPGFNGGTPVVTSFESGLGGMDVVGDGGLVIAGPACCGAVLGQPVRVGRLTSGGIFDTGFGGTGQRFVDDVARTVEVDAVVVLSNGKIDVVGAGGSGGNAFALQLKPNGKLDNSFGHRGIAYMNRSDLRVAGAAVDGDRRLAIVGSTPFRPSYSVGLGQVSVLRRLSDGRPDRTFGGGSLVHLVSPRSSVAVTDAMQSHGRIVVLAEATECSRSCPPPKTLLIRYLGGDSRARCAGHKATIAGTRRGETLTGTGHRDVIVALGGDDVVRGGGGNDLICGGLGNDRLNGGKGRDRLIGGAGRNHVRQ